MIPKAVTICAICFYLLSLVQGLVAAQPVPPCELPQDLQREIATKYPGAKLVSLSDLSDDNKAYFKKDHGDACPGLVNIDFYGDRKPTLALALISGAGADEKSQLVVAHQVGKDWNIASVETAKSAIPVVWSQGPGTYRDVYGDKQIRATRPVIVFGEYGGWIVLYSWTGTKVDKIWLID